VNLFRSFAWKREKIPGEDESRDLQLAAIGTVGDIMPLADENRIIVRGGLRSMAPDGSPGTPPGAGPRPGISELLEKLGLSGARFGARDISWKLCPAINAGRRMGCPEKAAMLLFEKDPLRRESLAAELLELNARRKERKNLGAGRAYGGRVAAGSRRKASWRAARK
jgi:single-stranded-DNA-specific exonuclease